MSSSASRTPQEMNVMHNLEIYILFISEMGAGIKIILLDLELLLHADYYIPNIPDQHKFCLFPYFYLNKKFSDYKKFTYSIRILKITAFKTFLLLQLSPTFVTFKLSSRIKINTSVSVNIIYTVGYTRKRNFPYHPATKHITEWYKSYMNPSTRIWV